MHKSLSEDILNKQKPVVFSYPLSLSTFVIESKWYSALPTVMIRSMDDVQPLFTAIIIVDGIHLRPHLWSHTVLCAYPHDGVTDIIQSISPQYSVHFPYEANLHEYLCP